MRGDPRPAQVPAQSRVALLDRDPGSRIRYWEQARAQLSWLPGGRGLNIAYETVDRHAAGPRADVTAVRWVGRHDEVTALSYRQLRDLTARFADGLRRLGVGRTERVFTLLGRVPELYVAALGTLKAGCVLAPLFSAFGPEPVRARLHLGEGSVLVTSPQLYRRKIGPLRGSLPLLRHVLVTGEDEPPPGTQRLADLLAVADPDFDIPPTSPEQVALLHFSGSPTGKLTGALHAHEAVVAHQATAISALGLLADDLFWCTADPGGVTGTSYGIIAPLSCGATLLSYEDEFDALHWYRALEQHRVTVWYTASTAIRMLMRRGADLAARYDLSALRFVASVGEPLNAEAVRWGSDVLGRPVHDTWWQAETGAIMIGNPPGEPPRPGSMGRPVPGIEAGLLERGEDGRARCTGGRVHELTGADVAGELAIRTGWPSMFRGYLHDDTRYLAAFAAGTAGAAGWYLTGDIARRDPQGRYWFVGKTDYVIKSAGRLVGPFEVESVLMTHPAVAEVGVIGKPDPVAGELVKAFVTLRDSFPPSEGLRGELLAFGRRQLGSVAPEELVFDAHLPHTRSGKVMRRLLKARELGVREGDLSTSEASQ